MFARRRQERTSQVTIGLKYALAAAFVVAPCTDITRAADCPPAAEVHIPEAPPPPLNIDKVKEVLLKYQSSHYDADVAAVFAKAGAYIEQRATQVTRPALILDIDETSLSNWQNIRANNFGFISDGSCDRLPGGPCGFKEWILRSDAPAIMPSLNLFNAAQAKGVSVIFITGRRDRERQATLWNLDRVGFQGWAKLITRRDDDTRLVQVFKSEKRATVAALGYTIIANVGDQDSDLDGGHAECKFKVPNPFYFIP
jgi:acid phosphatase